ncbi:MAG: 3-phosphoshikimate 1-carboxyvinyltransferase [Treponema sp.]|nr:3-phosphoshikimate 1-carboxyvinyltransferase [Treponema sp.]MCL2252095.1 3-phosphoshikimate 1-carboxyvinyltransferase [Treponema sp.]
MDICISSNRFPETVRIPASKSHTIRQLFIALLADGYTKIYNPLDCYDTNSCISACKELGANISLCCDDNENIYWNVKGVNGFKDQFDLYKQNLNDQLFNKSFNIDVGNSGTTLYLALAVAGLQLYNINFTGDRQIQKRSAAPLLDALANLGVQVQSKEGCVPILIKGAWKGGKVSISCPTSQYLSALLIAAPIAPSGTVTEIDVPLLNEKPYVEMTLSYLKAHDIPFEAAPDFSHFKIPGGSSWKVLPQKKSVPADFSSAAFPAAAAAITGGPVTLHGLDPQDTQGDKFFFEMLSEMGCDITWNGKKGEERSITVSRKGALCGKTFDLNATPDLLPAAAVVAAFAEGDTTLANVANARIKETDRIAVMAGELAKLGVNNTELPDGLIVHGKGKIRPVGGEVLIDGHGDHRIVMAFSVAALGSPVPFKITTAESAAVTYPGFFELFS